MNDDRNDRESSDESLDGEDHMASRILRSLRRREQVDSTFAARVMSAVHAEAGSRRRSEIERDSPASTLGWWRRKRTVSLSPLGGLGMAAGIAGLLALGMRSDEATPPAPTASTMRATAAPETVHVVRFVFTDREAVAVSLVGDFNAWSKLATPLEAGNGDGTWVVAVELPPGRHEYAFVVRRGGTDRWAADPHGLPVRDDFGTESSVVTVGRDGSHADRVTTS